MLPNPETKNFVKLVKEPYYLRLYDNEKRNMEPSKVAFTIDFDEKPKTLAQTFKELFDKKIG